MEATVIEKKDITSPTVVERLPDRPVFQPAADIVETPEHVWVIADMPGVDERSLSLTLEHDILTIEGRASAEEPSGARMGLREYEVGDYVRSFVLSNAVDRQGIQATVKNGVLRVMLPKTEDVKPRKIQVVAGT